MYCTGSLQKSVFFPCLIDDDAVIVKGNDPPGIFVWRSRKTTEITTVKPRMPKNPIIVRIPRILEAHFQINHSFGVMGFFQSTA
jgi:hypothetical protein